MVETKQFLFDLLRTVFRTLLICIFNLEQTNTKATVRLLVLVDSSCLQAERRKVASAVYANTRVYQVRPLTHLLLAYERITNSSNVSSMVL